MLHVQQFVEHVSTGGKPVEGMADIALSPELRNEKKRRLWLEHYREKLGRMGFEELVRESMRMRFHCGHYVMMRDECESAGSKPKPGFKACLYALKDHCNRIGFPMAMRRCNRKNEMFQIAMRAEVQFDITPYIKPTTEHMNKGGASRQPDKQSSSQRLYGCSKESAEEKQQLDLELQHTLSQQPHAYDRHSYPPPQPSSQHPRPSSASPSSVNLAHDPSSMAPSLSDNPPSEGFDPIPAEAFEDIGFLPFNPSSIQPLFG